MKKYLNNLQDTKKFAKEFLALVRCSQLDKVGETISGDTDRNVILLQGELGTGKTTFSQFLLKEFSANGPFTSPTFVIMKKYELKEGDTFYSDGVKNVYHLDCYRVDSDSVLDLGWEEIIADKSNLLLVEWPEKIKKIWPKKYWLLKFEYGSDKNTRIVKIIKK